MRTESFIVTFINIIAGLLSPFINIVLFHSCSLLYISIMEFLLFGLYLFCYSNFVNDLNVAGHKRLQVINVLFTDAQVTKSSSRVASPNTTKMNGMLKRFFEVSSRVGGL